ncbi:uncharacterized protein LOC111625685 [Centruroides sculpturatus]|uniref:uncharacterized protein LOC111625685 n=1 Tax=Centruroides sculpturatus TaxID=218467 RepID=UPI000C6CD8C6|nr:uncharacterized protein LOC111625685 [Centruroides sculpturatus]
MKFLLIVLALFVLAKEGRSLDAFDILDKYCATKDQDALKKCMAENGKSKLFTYFESCARPLRRHMRNSKETSKFICKEVNEKEDFLIRCCLAYKLKKDRDSSLPRIFQSCVNRGVQSEVSSQPIMQQQGYVPYGQQLGYLSPAQQGSVYQPNAQVGGTDDDIPYLGLY